MKAAVLQSTERKLVIRDIAIPKPRQGEALIEVTACGVCHTDLHVINGDVNFPRPAVLGHEVSGTIVEINEDERRASGRRVGEVVVGAFIMPCTACTACMRGRDDLCANFFAMNRLKGTLYDGESRLAMPDGSFLAMYSMGGLAEYCVMPLSALTPLPSSLDADTACILGCAGLTSYGAVYRVGRVERRQSVAVIGAGGIGLSVIQMARSAGASPIIAVDIAADKLERARAMGATSIVNSLEQDPVVAARMLEAEGVDVAFEAIGRPSTFRQALGMLADGGTMVAIGIAAGSEAAEIEITPLVRRGYTISGSFGGRTRTDLPEVVRLASEGEFGVSELVTRRYPLDQVDEAYRALMRGQITGRAIVTMKA